MILFLELNSKIKVNLLFKNLVLFPVISTVNIKLNLAENLDIFISSMADSVFVLINLYPI